MQDLKRMLLEGEKASKAVKNIRAITEKRTSGFTDHDLTLEDIRRELLDYDIAMEDIKNMAKHNRKLNRLDVEALFNREIYEHLKARNRLPNDWKANEFEVEVDDEVYYVHEKAHRRIYDEAYEQGRIDTEKEYEDEFQIVPKYYAVVKGYQVMDGNEIYWSPNYRSKAILVTKPNKRPLAEWQKIGIDKSNAVFLNKKVSNKT